MNDPAGRDYMAWWTEEQFAYFCNTRERLRPKFNANGVAEEDMEHRLNVAAIQEMQEHGVLEVSGE